MANGDSQNPTSDGQMQINPAPVNPAPTAPATPAEPAATAPAAPQAVPAMPSMPEAKPEAEAAQPAAPAAAPAAPVSAANTTEENKNVFTELFGDDQSQKGAALMDSVLDQQDKKSKSMFGKDSKKLAGFKKKGKNKLAIRKTGPGKLLLRASVILLIATMGYFFTQNWDGFTWFGANMAQKAALAEENVEVLETEILVQEFLAGALLLDQYSTLADEYLYYMDQSESDYVSANKQDDYAEAAEDMRPDLVDLLDQAQTYTGENVDYEDRLDAEALVDELITELRAKSGQVDETTLLQDIQDLETTKTLLSSVSFRNSFAGYNLEEITDEEIEEIYTAYNEISLSVTAIINDIKASRINWSEYLAEIEDLTKDVDPLFNTQYEGNIKINDINLTESVVTIAGEAVTDDSKNFTLISNLIDTYESSDTFMNVQDRSYSKSGDDESYSGTFRISMQIEDLTQTE